MNPTTPPEAALPQPRRMAATEPPHIEDVLEQYADVPDLTMMALGSSYWGPPADALTQLATHDVTLREVHRYGNITGDLTLKRRLTELLAARGLDMAGQVSFLDLCNKNTPFFRSPHTQSNSRRCA